MDRDMLQVILKNLPWPIVLLVVVFMFRKTIKKLIDRIIKLKGGGVHIDMTPVTCKYSSQTNFNNNLSARDHFCLLSLGFYGMNFIGI